MLNWDTASTLTKAMLITTIAAVLVGFVIVMVGAATQNIDLFTTAAVFLGIGIVAHMVGFGSRMRDGRRSLKQKLDGAGTRRGK